MLGQETEGTDAGKEWGGPKDGYNGKRGMKKKEAGKRAKQGRGSGKSREVHSMCEEIGKNRTRQEVQSGD